MGARGSLQRLLHIRRTEEEHCQLTMEKAIAELRHLETLRIVVCKRGERARTLLVSSARSGDLVDRIVALEETSITGRMEPILADMVERARLEAERRRQEFLAKRVARQQVETLADKLLTEGRVKAGRKNQSALDDWHRSRRLRSKSDNLLTE
jgi:flagellar biosynthesis chaperone FliJ